MSSLTEEQRKRIEENKRKALALRAAKLGNANSSPLNSSSSSSSYTNGNTSSFTGLTGQASLPVVINNGSCTAVLNPGPAKPTGFHQDKFNHFKNQNQNNTNKATLSAASLYGTKKAERSTVTCTLISKNRFAADFHPFNKNIIEIFKTVTGKLYDPTLTRWHFPLSSYQECKKLLEKSGECVIVPLPNYILKMFLHTNIGARPTDYKTIDISRIEPSLLASLYPFQREGVQFGISKNGRCIIADDMGLGKTIQAIAIAHYYQSDWPLFIACPSSMKYQWEEEIRNYLPAIPVTKIFVLSKSKEQIHNPLVLITSYELMAKCEDQLLSMQFGVTIMDESHSMKNIKAKRTKTALKLIERAKRCILLSGTPALSRPIELYPQMKAIEKLVPSMTEFGIRYCNAKMGRFGMDYMGSCNMEELKVVLEERFMIRRLKSLVLSQLPSKIRQVVVLDKEAININKKVMSAFESKLNDETIKGTERRGCLLQYFAETGKMKLKAIKDYICQILETGNKFLVFAHHKVVLDEICELLEEKETFFIRVDGSVQSEERKSVCDQFQMEDKFRAAVLSITAASTGLTLTAAHVVIFAELFWNPGILTQAEDRVHRIGQQDSVLVQYLIATGTADDYLWPLIKEKLHILNQAGLSKDNFSCERTSVTTTHEQRSIMDFFDEIGEFDADLSQVVDDVEEIESKRKKLN